MAEKHWTPPNRPHLGAAGALSTGEFPTMGKGPATSFTWVRPKAGETVSRKDISKSVNPTAGGKANRRNKLLGNERYGPAGIVKVARSVSEPYGAETGRSVHRVPPAFGTQDEFRGGARGGN